MTDEEPIIGIDLGTTNSVVATVQDGSPVVIKNRTGQNLTPSVVAISRTGKRLVGTLARRQAITNPQDTIHASKRLIGRKFSSPQVQDALKRLSYQVVAGEHDDVRVRLGGKDVSLPEIASIILQELKADAEAHLGRSVSRAVITVPAYFNDGQRQATKDAGRIAGLDVLRILNEPTAAALAYGFGKSVTGKIAVFDLGGGTFDLSILEVARDVFDVVATGGDTYLGGEDWDNRVMDWLASEFQREHGVDLRQEPMALQRLKEAAEKAKMELSDARTAQINLPFLYTPPGGSGALHLQATLHRDKLEALTADLCERTLKLTAEVLAEARLDPKEIQEVILVGGMTRMPRLVELVKRFFGRDPCKGVHPEEVVALGAALQAHALVARRSDVLLLDVTPQSLGVAVAGGFVRRLIPRNTTLPTSTTQVFTTSRDEQETVRIVVLQGEEEAAHLNEMLGEFVLTGLRRKTRGAVEVEVTFTIDADGIVSVAAKDKETGLSQSMTVTASSGLTEDELRRILESKTGDLVAEVGSSEEVKGSKAALEATVQELETLVKQSGGASATSDFLKDMLAKASRQMEHARKVMGRADTGSLSGAVQQLSRTVQSLKGLLRRSEKPDEEKEE